MALSELAPTTRLGDDAPALGGAAARSNRGGPRPIGWTGAMKRITAAALAAGTFLLAGLVWVEGPGAVWHSAGRLGVVGFASVSGIHLALMGLMGSGWWLLERTGPSRWPRFAWGRAVRDSAAEVLPLSQLGGYVLGARAVVLAGVPGPFAAASTVVDVTVELVAQLGYTLLGLVLLDRLQPHSGFTAPVFAGIAAMAGLAVLFIIVQARGFGMAGRAGVRLTRTILGRGLRDAGQIQSRILALHARRRTLLAACGIHLSAWVLNGVETWLTLRLIGMRLGLAEGLVIDSLLYGMRSVAFIVPSAAGVQEGGLILLCGLFGVGADAALALSLIKRARDLAIGLPVLLAWQGLEGRRALRRGPS